MNSFFYNLESSFIQPSNFSFSDHMLCGSEECGDYNYNNIVTGTKKEGSHHVFYLRNTSQTDEIIKNFAPFPGLLSSAHRLEKVHTIDVGDTEFSDEGVFYLSDYPLLTRLSLRNTKITDSAIVSLPFLRLEVLDLESTKITDAVTPFFTQFHELQVLNLSKTEITDKSLRYLACIPKLTTLCIQHVKIKRDDIAELRNRKPSLKIEWGSCYIQKLPKALLSMITSFLDEIEYRSVKQLSSFFHQIVPLEFHLLRIRSYKHLNQFMHKYNSKIVSFYLSKPGGISDLEIEMREKIATTLKKMVFQEVIDEEELSFLKTLTNLTDLTLVCDGDQTTMKSLKCLQKLNKLQFQIENIDDISMSPLPYLPHLKVLGLNFTEEDVSDENVAIHNKSMESLAHFDKLIELRISGAFLQKSSGLNFLTKLNQLQTLEISHNRRTLNRAMLNIAYLTNLTRLFLQGMCLKDKGLGLLARSLSNLNVLNISKNDISDEGIAHLKHLKNLIKLFIIKIKITDKGLNILAQSCSKLQVLDLSNNQVTDEGMPYVARLLNLKKVIIKQTQVTEDGSDLLQEALPDLCIEESEMR